MYEIQIYLYDNIMDTRTYEDFSKFLGDDLSGTFAAALMPSLASVSPGKSFEEAALMRMMDFDHRC